MLYTYKELINKYKSNYYINKALANRKIYKIDSYIYSNERYVDYLLIINKKYPKVIFTSDSAYYYYGLTTYVPDKYYVATSRKDTKIVNSKLKQSYIPEDRFNIGVSSLKVNNINIKIYDKERLLIDLIRKSDSLPFDYYKEIINNYRLIKDKLDMKKISSYLKHYNSKKKIFEAIQKEVY